MGHLGIARDASSAAAGLCPLTVQKPTAKSLVRFIDTANWTEVWFRNTAQQVWGYTFKQLHKQPHRLNLKFSSTVQTSLVFFKWYSSKTMRTLMQFSCGGQHANKAHLSLIKITKWSLGKAYLYYCINFHSFLPSWTINSTINAAINYILLIAVVESLPNKQWAVQGQLIHQSSRQKP